MKLKVATHCLLAVAMFSLAKADLVLGAPFESNMILQRSALAPFWGWTTPDTAVTITVPWAIPSQVVSDRNGRFEALIQTPASGGPHTITFQTATQSETISGVLLGDVYLAAGQSNMESPSYNLPSGYPAVLGWETNSNVTSTNQIRFTRYSSTPSGKSPNDVLNLTWQNLQSGYANNVSAIAFKVATRLQTATNVPIGIMMATRGSTAIQQWVPQKQMGLILRDRNGSLAHTYSQQYNARVHPFTPAAISGILWMQGESDVFTTNDYKLRFTTLIDSWRTAFRSQDIPFLYSQIGRFNSWPNNRAGLIRSAQTQAEREVPNVYMVPSLDVSDPTQIHFPDKYPLGDRMADWLLQTRYGFSLPNTEPPRITTVTRTGNSLEIAFDKPVTTTATTGFSVLTPSGSQNVTCSAGAGSSSLTVVIPASATKLRYHWIETASPTIWSGNNIPLATCEIAL